MLVSIALYFYRLGPAGPYAPDPLAALRDPVAALRFYLCLVGAPLIQGVGSDPAQFALIAGGVLSACFIALVVLGFRQRRSELAVLLGIGLYAQGFLVMTAIGRMGWGSAVAATTSRYMPQSVLLLCALVCAAWCFSINTRRYSWLVLAFGVLLTLSMFGNSAGLETITATSAKRECAASLLPFLDDIARPTDKSRYGPLFPLWPLEPNTGAVVRDNYPILQRLGFRPPGRRALFNTAPRKHFGVIESASISELSSEQATTLTGWAVLPELKRPASLVVITRNDESSIIAAAWVGSLKLPWLADYYEVPSYVNGGWKVDLPASFLHPGTNAISAWAYEPTSGEFMRLHHPTGLTITKTE